MADFRFPIQCRDLTHRRGGSPEVSMADSQALNRLQYLDETPVESRVAPHLLRQGWAELQGVTLRHWGG